VLTRAIREIRRLATAGLAALVLALPCGAGAVEPGGPVPDVSAPELGKPDRSISFGELRGTVVYVDFWASWCVPCRQSMPALDQLYRKYRDRGFRVVGVNKDVTLEDAQHFLTRVPVTFPLVADGKDRVARAFDVQAMPCGYLVDRKGVVRRVHRGYTAETAAALSGEVEALLRESP